jgi:hypothetical protein
VVFAVVAAGAVPAAHAVNVAQDEVVAEDPVDSTPWVRDGTVLAIAKVGATVVVGGTFTQVSNANSAIQNRSYLIAFDEATGQLIPGFAPTLNGSVNALVAAADGTSVYVGGAFTTVNGFAQRGVTRLDVATGARNAAFTARTNGTVADLALNGGRLYLGGYFTAVNSVTRQYLAGVDATSGGLLAGPNSTLGQPFFGTTKVLKIDVSPSGDRLVAIGGFSVVDGQSRPQIAQWDLTGSGATLSSWATDSFGNVCNTSFHTYMRDVDFSPDGAYFAVVTTGAWTPPPALCDTTSRWEAGTSGGGHTPTWAQYTGGDTLWSVAVTTNAIYVGGHPRWQNNPYRHNNPGDGAIAREGIAALDPLTGMPLRWDPGHTRGVGTQALVVTADRLYVGSDTDIMGGEFHPRFGAFPLAGGYAPVQPEVVTLPVMLHHLRGGEVHDVRFDGVTLTDEGLAESSINWSGVRGAFSQHGRIYYVNGDGRFYSRTWDGTTLGDAVDLMTEAGYVATFPRGWTTAVAELAYANGKLFYTKEGSDQIFWRFFGLDASVLGGQEFVAATSGANAVRGMEIVSGQMYLARTDGTLRRAPVGANGTVNLAASAMVDTGASGIAWATGRDLWFDQTEGDPPPPPPPAGTGDIAWGAHVEPHAGESMTEAVQRFEAAAGRKLDVVRVFKVWNEPLADSFTTWLRDTDHRLVLSVYPQRSNGTRVLWSDIAAATPGTAIYDDIVEWADSVGAWGDPMTFTFNHEPETVGNIPFGSDADFIAAWRNVVDIFGARGVTNAEFLWIMTDYSFNLPATDRRAAARWYPGDAYVDAIGADAYNWFTCRPDDPTPWQPLEEVAEGLRQFGIQHPHADLWLPEFASVEDPSWPGRKARWMEEAQRLFQEPGWEQFTGALHFDRRHPAAGTMCDWEVDSSPSAFDAVHALGADPFFGGTGAGPVPMPSLLFVLSDPAVVSASDQALIDRLRAQGYTVTVMDDNVATGTDAAGVDAVVLSSSAAEVPTGARFRNVATPVLTWKPYLYDDLRMTNTVANTDYGNSTVSSIGMLATTHPLRNGLSGTQVVFEGSRTAGWGVPLASADRVATIGTTRSAIFVYQPGDLMAQGLVAPGCRVGFPGGNGTMNFLTMTGRRMFDAAVEYVSAGCS